MDNLAERAREVGCAFARIPNLLKLIIGKNTRSALLAERGDADNGIVNYVATILAPIEKDHGDGAGMVMLSGRILKPVEPLRDLRVSDFGDLPFEREMLRKVPRIVGDSSWARAFGFVGEELLYGLQIPQRLGSQAPKREFSEEALCFVARVSKGDDRILSDRDALIVVLEQKGLRTALRDAATEAWECFVPMISLTLERWL